MLPRVSGLGRRFTTRWLHSQRSGGTPTFAGSSSPGPHRSSATTPSSSPSPSTPTTSAGRRPSGSSSSPRLIPGRAVAPFAGMLGDRYPRERVLLYTNVTRVALVSASAVACSPTRIPGRLRALHRRDDRDDTVSVGTGRAHAVARATPEELTAANAVASGDREHRALRRPRPRRCSPGDVASTGVVFTVTAL